MPGGDRTGPMGLGPMTGRAAGYCVDNNVPGFTNPFPRRALWNYGGSMVSRQGLAYRGRMPYGITQPYFFGAFGGRCGRGLGRVRGRRSRWFGW